jgi:hypothetical protein
MVAYNRHFHPVLISSQGSTRQHGVNYYKLYTTYKPSFHDIRTAQEQLGFHPAGYGGPSNLDITQEGKKWVSRWESSSSCE